MGEGDCLELAQHEVAWVGVFGQLCPINARKQTMGQKLGFAADATKEQAFHLRA